VGGHPARARADAYERSRPERVGCTTCLVVAALLILIIVVMLVRSCFEPEHHAEPLVPLPVREQSGH
jgi:hypothetical protein